VERDSELGIIVIDFRRIIMEGVEVRSDRCELTFPMEEFRDRSKNAGRISVVGG